MSAPCYDRCSATSDVIARLLPVPLFSHRGDHSVEQQSRMYARHHHDTDWFCTVRENGRLRNRRHASQGCKIIRGRVASLQLLHSTLQLDCKSSKPWPRTSKGRALSSRKAADMVPTVVLLWWPHLRNALRTPIRSKEEPSVSRQNADIALCCSASLSLTCDVKLIVEPHQRRRTAARCGLKRACLH